MSNLKRIYISGPMTGLPNFNYDAFNAAADRLRNAGWQEVINPAENFGGRKDLPRVTYLRADVVMLAKCDAIAMLPGWEKSRGAKLEYMLACELGMKIFDAGTLRPLADVPAAMVLLHPLRRLREALDTSILADAKRLTSGDRQDDYGHPSDDFARTALMWTGILSEKLQEGAEISAMYVPLCMIAVKLARQAHRHKRDNLVDIAGYARTAAMIAGDE